MLRVAQVVGSASACRVRRLRTEGFFDRADSAPCPRRLSVVPLGGGHRSVSLKASASYRRNGRTHRFERRGERKRRERLAPITTVSGPAELGRWDVVAQLARAIEARRLAAVGVRSLVDERGRRPGKECASTWPY